MKNKAILILIIGLIFGSGKHLNAQVIEGLNNNLTLKNLKAEYCQNSVCFSWEGRDIIEGGYYALERSYDNKKFTTVLIKSSYVSRSSVFKEYFFTDTSVLQDEVYYRIRYIYDSNNKLGDHILHSFKVKKDKPFEKELVSFSISKETL